MIEKPVHRRRSLLSNASAETPAATFWLLPALLLVQALFLGSTFYTMGMSLGAMVFAFLVVGIALQYAAAHESALLDSGVQDSPKQTGTKSRSDAARTESLHWSQWIVRRGDHARAWRSLVIIPTVLVTVSIGAALRVIHHLTENLNPIAMIVDSVAHAAFLASLTLWVFFPRRGHPAMLGCGLLLVLTSVSGGGVSHSINGQLVAALGTVVGFAFAADHILMHWQIDRALRSRRRRQKRLASDRGSAENFEEQDQLGNQRDAAVLPASTVTLSTQRSRNPLLYSMLALSILLMSTSAVGHMASNVVPGLQLDFFDRLSQSLEAVTANTIIGGSRYVRGSKLGAIRQHMLGSPSDPAVSAYAKTTPGYLRGTVFDFYRNGRWSAVTERMLDRRADLDPIRQREVSVEMPGQISLEGRRNNLQLNRFPVRKNPGEPTIGTIEIYNVPMKGRLLFTSLSTEWIEGSTFGTTTLTHHDLVAKGVDALEPYVLGIGENTPREQLEPLRRQIMLTLPPGMEQEIGPITRSICASHLTARTKSRAIEDYFQENFSYSLNATTPSKGVDPLVHFLETQHPAHCEFFASAAAMMLRIEGVPTRYVTGYVVSERSDDGRYWLARNRDAHAWVEAYDDITERWFPVEATVGRTYRTLSVQSTTLDDSERSLGDFLDDGDDSGILAMVSGWLLSFRATDSLTFVFRIAQLPLFCLVVGLLYLRHRQKLRAGRDPMEYESRQMLSRVDRDVRRHSLVRGRSETLHQFADRVASQAAEKPDEQGFLDDAADWYRAFASARYRGVMPAPFHDGR